MRVAIITILCVAGLLGAALVFVPRVVLSHAKHQALKRFKDDRKILDCVPQADVTDISPSTNSATILWLDVASCRVGFPENEFKRPADTAHSKRFVYCSRYRVMVDQFANSTEFTPVMQPLGFTNLYRFYRCALMATEREIMSQPDMQSLRRLMVLLSAKAMFAPPGFEDHCAEFNRGDFEGFIIGDPQQDPFVIMRIYVEDCGQFITIGIIPKAHIQMSDVVDLLSELKVLPNTALEPTPHSRRGLASKFSDLRESWVRGGSAFVR